MEIGLGNYIHKQYNSIEQQRLNVKRQTMRIESALRVKIFRYLALQVGYPQIKCQTADEQILGDFKPFPILLVMHEVSVNCSHFQSLTLYRYENWIQKLFLISQSKCKTSDYQIFYIIRLYYVILSQLFIYLKAKLL